MKKGENFSRSHFPSGNAYKTLEI